MILRSCLDLCHRVGKAAIGQPGRVTRILLAHAQPRQSHGLPQRASPSELFVERASERQSRTVRHWPLCTQQSAATQLHQVSPKDPSRLSENPIRRSDRC